MIEGPDFSLVTFRSCIHWWVGYLGNFSSVGILLVRFDDEIKAAENRLHR